MARGCIYSPAQHHKDKILKHLFLVLPIAEILIIVHFWEKGKHLLSYNYPITIHLTFQWAMYDAQCSMKS